MQLKGQHIDPHSEIYIQQHPSKTHQRKLPEGQKFRFVAISQDPTKSPLYREARCRQKQFLIQSDFCPITGIKDLDLAVNLGNNYGYMTLQQVVLRIKTKIEPS